MELVASEEREAEREKSQVRTKQEVQCLQATKGVPLGTKSASTFILYFPGLFKPLNSSTLL